MVDPFALLANILTMYWWAIPLLILTTWLRSPSGKGWCGETYLNTLLFLALPRTQYHLRSNLTLPTADGTTQIDHVVVSRHGIFIIETKNYGGWIFGKAGDKNWTQKFPRRSSTFQNPLRQNYKHVRAVAELTGADEAALISLVVFVGDATFKTPMPPNVTHARACLDFIRAHTDLLLDSAEVVRLLGALDAGRLAPSRRTHAAHVAHVRALQARAVSNGAPRAAVATPAPEPAPPPVPAPATPLHPACPQCGSAVAEYAYKTGDKAGRSFQGCTQFPGCTYRVDVPA